MRSHDSPTDDSTSSAGAYLAATSQRQRRSRRRALRLAPLIAATLFLVTLGMQPAAATSAAPTEPAPILGKPAQPQATSTPITISPLFLPNGQVDTPYHQSMIASGGTAPYTFALTDGALPPGLALSPAGALEGTPSTEGFFSFIMSATDARGVSTNVFYQLNILTPIALGPSALLEGKVGSAYHQIFSASGGTAPYTFALTDGALPPGLALSPAGALEGTPSTEGFFSFTITATDARGISGPASYSVFIAQALIVSPFSLLDGEVGTTYSQILIASGGTAPYRFALTDGALPPGLTISSAGTLSGNPTAPGFFNFTITATDARGLTGRQQYSLAINQVPLVISPGGLPDGRVGVTYLQQFTASGGAAPYRFAITDGALPPGLTLSRDGRLSGTPRAEGFFSFTLTATDARGRSSSQFYGLSITPVTLSISPSLLPAGKVGLPYRQRLTASGGTAPYRFAIAFGALPPGLALSADGWLRGRPTTVGYFGFTIAATDARGHTISQSYALTIGQQLTITPPFLPNGLAGAAYQQALAASGGTAPYRFTVTDGALPPGLTLSPAGVLSGMLSQEGYFGFSVTATDARGRTGSWFYQITAYSPIGISPPALLDGKVGRAYRQVFAASGGTAPYGFAVTGGALPPGLTLSAAGVLEGTPTADGGSSFTITATDARGISGMRFYSMFVAQALEISPAALPQGFLDTDYSATLTASGGTAPYTFAIAYGELPPGLALSADGVLSGVPTTQGFFGFGVIATDADGKTGSWGYSLAISAPLIVISPDTLPGGSMGVAYQQQLSASGGTGPYVFVATDFLPPGLILSPAGVLHGTPTAAGSFNFVVTVFDSRGFVGGQPYTLLIEPITISPPGLPSAMVGVPYSQRLAASGGVGPYIFLDVSFFPPSGLTLSRDGLLSGTPTSDGFFSLDVQVIDSRGFSSRQAYLVEIVQPLAITSPTLPDGAVGSSYNAIIAISGGSFPYSCAVTDGAVPPGLELAGSGELSGTPTAAGVYSFTVTVTDGGGRTASQQYTVVIN